MCGICGQWHIESGTERTLELLEKMTTTLSHRGPDQEGYYEQHGMGLGFRRLAIVDSCGGHQPFSNENGLIRVVFNGEIYNYRELINELTNRGHLLNQGSDGDVLAHLYEEWGFTLANRLRGVFAAAIWDECKRRLLLFRDRLGVKPLYYWLSPDQRELKFASEIKALLKGGVQPVLDPLSLDLYLSTRYVPAPFTIFQGIRKVEPGTCVMVQEKEHRLVCQSLVYWQMPEEQYMVDKDIAIEEIRHHLWESWRIRWPEEVRAGYFFSGGLDSSGLVAMHQAAGLEQARTYAVGFEQPRLTKDFRFYSELDQAKAVAKILGTQHSERLVGRAEVEQRLPEIIQALDEPIADPTAIPLYFLSETATVAGEKVIFSGEGADELFGGYSVYWEPINRRLYQATPAWLRAGAAKLMPQLDRHYQRNLTERYAGVGGLLNTAEKNSLYRMDILQQQLSKVKQYFGFEELTNTWRAEEESMLRFDMRSWLPENTLMKSDKITMAHSLEIRVPYLDHKLVEYTMGLETGLKIQRGRTKELLRQAMRAYLPPQLCRQAKNGFPVPLTAWIAGEWQHRVREIVFDAGNLTAGVFNLSKLEVFLQQTNSQRAARLLWALYSLELYWQSLSKQPQNMGIRRPKQKLVNTAR
ncbi:asparagine synthase (glutamine-hydrolyzing) [Desulfosporosinus sp. SB140]|uniref:asparagine synthase (glutamine-hydrolyzing) n=1 Tax=Desulfosporosinus paludis TaxID=3115649 RepID=UPI00388DF3C8